MQLKLWRNLYHLLAGLFFAFLCYFVSKKTMLLGLGIATLISILIEYIRLRFSEFNRWLIVRFSLLLRPYEERHVTGQTYFALGCFLTVLLFSKNIAITSLVFLAVGDVAGAIVGAFFGRTKLLRKSIEGTGACWLACFLTGLILHFTVVFNEPFVLFVGALAAALGESLSIPPDDNLTMPLFTGAVMYLCDFWW